MTSHGRYWKLTLVTHYCLIASYTLKFEQSCRVQRCPQTLCSLSQLVGGGGAEVALQHMQG